MTASPAPAAPEHRAAVAVERVAGRSAVTTLRSAGPLRLLSPTADGDAAWVYQSSLGGGFVTTDALALDVRVGAGASLFLSSQSASKVYRTADARFSLHATVADAATLVAWPDPTACFADAALTQHQHFALATPAARLVVVDAFTAGRPAHNGERWAFARLDTRISITLAGTPILDDALLLSRDHGPLAARMGATVGAFATIIVVGPARPALSTPHSPFAHGTVIRVAAPSADELHSRVSDILAAHITALLAADPWARKY